MWWMIGDGLTIGNSQGMNANFFSIKFPLLWKRGKEKRMPLLNEIMAFVFD
jgi:hypothetical protein